ncbi:MAG: alpha/beta hydrolase [Coriobacteriales bacterium]|nr:alpha/beta hydrolase [Coriobacteriales bacterium]
MAREKQYKKNPTDGEDVTFETLFEDLVETVRYLKRKYQKEKIIIQGHSWGTILGLRYAHQFTEDVLFYIGAGQVIDYMHGERINLQKMKRLAAGSERSYRTIEAIERKLDSAKGYLPVKDLNKIKKKYGLGINFMKVSRIAMKSPVFGFTDVLAMIRAQKQNVHLLNFLSTFSAMKMTNFRVPVYFIHGENDGQVPISQVKDYFETITAPDKGFFSITCAGHISAVDNLDGVLAAMGEIQGRFERLHSSEG